MTDQPPPPPPPVAQPPAGAWASQAVPAAKPPSKLRTYLVFGVIAALVVIGGYFISQNQKADELVVGQCFDEPGRSVDITTVVKHACTDPHDAEVFAVVEYDEGDAYPASADSFVEEKCIPAFTTYVGQTYEENADYKVGYFYPDETGWNQGDRTFTCYISREDASKLTQSVKGSATS